MNFKKIITGLLLSLLLGSGVAVAADFSVGLQAAQSGDFKTALAEWTPLAEQGLAIAQSNLGFMHARGSGVLTDNRRVYMWWNLASYNGYENAGEYKNNIAKQMTPADISKAQDMSSRCLESNYTDC